MPPKYTNKKYSVQKIQNSYDVADVVLMYRSGSGQHSHAMYRGIQEKGGTYEYYSYEITSGS